MKEMGSLCVCESFTNENKNEGGLRGFFVLPVLASLRANE